MIFFGSNKTEIAAGELAGVTCVNCGNVGTVEAHIYSKVCARVLDTGFSDWQVGTNKLFVLQVSVRGQRSSS